MVGIVPVYLLYTIKQVWLRCYKDYIFSIPEYCILVYSIKVQVRKGFSKVFLSSITKEIIAIKDDIYNFVENFESREYKGFSERRGGRGG